MKPIIESYSLGKKFRVANTERYHALRDALADSISSLGRHSKNADNYFWALQDIDLTVHQGERAAIIGNNGAGKSTLLKILSKITPPSVGRAKIHGRLASLLEVGTGFHPELTGRENIYFNGSVLGLKKAEIKRQFDAIVDFSGVSAFLDMPLKKYSTGMELRLAFAVAAHLEPEVLLIDEVLAVGDLEFQKKCIDKMNEVSRSNGKTILFVSHNLSAVKQLCTKAFLLHNGRISKEGKADDIVNMYVQQSLSTLSSAYQARPGSPEGKAVFFNSVFSSDSAGNASASYRLSDPIAIHIEIANPAQYRSFTLGIAVNDSAQRRIITDSYEINCDPGKATVELESRLPAGLLTPGTFTIDLSLEKKGSEMMELRKNVIRFDIIKSGTKFESLNYDYGVINASLTWKVKEQIAQP